MPGKHHRLFERMVGEWETTTRIYMGGPDGPAMSSTGTATYSWRVPGKWMTFHAKGTMMGTPMETWGVLGYDNFKQKYVSSWHDNLGTVLLHSEGTLDLTGKELMMWGSMDEPMTGQTDKTVRYHYKFTDKDTMIFEVHDLHIGQGKTKVIEMVFTRKK